jgi:membrane fusion protein (multidrug efflux system)
MAIKLKTLLKFSLAIFSFCIISQSFAAAAPSKMPPTVVIPVAAKMQQWQDSIIAVGSLNAFDGTMLTPEVTGRVTKVYFTSGQYIEKGQPIIQLYPDITLAQLEKAKAQYKLSQLDYERNKKLYELKYVDRATLDKYQATMESNRADVDTLNAQLNQLLIRAPFSGNLGLNKISIGDYLKPGDVIVSLQRVDPIRVDFSVPDVYLNQIKVDNAIEITARAFEKRYFGKIIAIDSAVNTNTRAIAMRGMVPNPEHILVPGTFVEVSIKVGPITNVIVVPQTAIVYASSGNFVYRLINHKAVKTLITLGKKLENNQIVVASGLKSGEIIVAEGQTKLHDGADAMTPTEYQQLAASKAPKSKK